MIRLLSKLWSCFLLTSYKRALASYQANAGEKEAVRLSQALMRLQRGSEAIAVITQARRAFPQSALLKRANTNIRRRHAKILLMQALKDLKKERTTESYIRVSDLYRTIGSLKRTFTCLHEAQKHFPDHWGIYFSLGKAYFHRFTITNKPNDCKECVECLRRANELHPDHYGTSLYLAMALARLESFHDARTIVESLLGRYPSDSRALSLRVYIEKKESEQSTPFDSTDADDSALVQLKSDTAVFQSPKGMSQSLRETLRSFPGGLGLFLLDETGALVDSAITKTDLFDFKDCAGPLQTLATGCRFDAERIGIGTLHSCLIASDEWRLVFREAEGIQLVAFFDSTASDESIEAAIDNVLSVASAA